MQLYRTVPIKRAANGGEIWWQEQHLAILPPQEQLINELELAQ